MSKKKNRDEKYDYTAYEFINNYHKCYDSILNKYMVHRNHKYNGVEYICSKYKYKLDGAKSLDNEDINIKKEEDYINIYLKNDYFNNYSERVFIINSLKDYIIFLNNYLSSYTIGNDNKRYRRRFIFRGINNLLVLKSKLFIDKYIEYNSDFGKKVETGTERVNEFDRCTNTIMQKEYELMQKFEENGSLKLKGYNTVNELIAFAKHYELNTRFVDWTYSPLVATLFAISEKPEIELSHYEKNSDVKTKDNEKNSDVKTKDNEKYYCVIVRNYTGTLIIKDLPICFNYQLDESKEVSKYIIDIINELNSISNNINQNLNYWYKKYQKAMKIFSIIYKLVLYLGDFRNEIKNRSTWDNFNRDFKDAVNHYGFNLDKKIICDIVYKYFETIYDLTNIKDSYLNAKIGAVSKMASKFISNGSKIILETPICNERLRNQRGIFEIDTYESYESQFADKTNNFMLISENAKHEIIKNINSLGINYYSIMDEPTSTSKIINDSINGKYYFDSEIRYKN